MATPSGAELGEIEQVYRRGYRRFVRTAAAIIGNEEAAADAVHDAFVRAVRDRRTFRRDAPVEAWLWRIVVNAAIAGRNANIPSRSALPEAVVPETVGNGYDSDADQRTRGALAALPQRQRITMFLRYYADLDYASIARVLEMSPGTVAATLHAAHANMRAWMEARVS